MFYIFLFLIVLFIIFFKFRSKNPYKLIYIFGKKGSGKTTLLTKYMLRDIRHGWTVYTDIDGINISGIRKISVSDLITCAPPARSSIYLDEVGMSMDNRDFKTFPKGLRDYFKLQRHFRNKVTIASQSFDVDLKVRQLVDSMILQTNLFGFIGISRPIFRSITLTEATSQGESRIADQLKFGSILSWRFTFMPRYYKYFNSFNSNDRSEPDFSEIDGLSPRRYREFLQKKLRRK